MSTWRERLEDAGTPEVAATWLGEYYHYPALLALVVFSFWTRVLNWGRFVSGGVFQFRGNDPYYHLRSVQYVVEHWPATMPFDPWTNFPTGTSVAQFGTLFDQVIATAALVAGFGDPSPELVRYVVMFAPVAFGLATIVPAYFIGRRLGGRFGGVVAAGVVVLPATDLLVQGSVASTDHHIAEALFQALAVLGVMVAVSAAESEKPVYELLAGREFGAIRRTLGWSLLAGVAIGVYLSIWPPGVLLLGILGVFFLIQLSVDFLRGRSPEHVAIAGVVSLVTAGVLALSMVDTVSVRATSRSLLQPGLAFAVAAGCAFMAWLARAWEERDLHPAGYPAAVLGVGALLAAAMAVLTPDVFGYIVANVRRVVGFQIGQVGGTIGEFQPIQDPYRLYATYKLATFGAIAAGAIVVFEHVLGDDPRSERLLIVVLALFITAAVFTQRRFLYYLTIPVAALNALLVGRVVTWVTRTTSDDDGIEGYQLMTIAGVLLVVLAPLVVFAPTAIDVANDRGPGGDIAGWQSGLDWLEENTPEPGQYARPDREPMDFLGTFERTADFDYPPGAYGVLSWWDYGHWITAVGERIPNANPFQQGTDVAAPFLIAQNESTAEGILESTDEDDAKTRYVMVDWMMAETEGAVSAKYFAPFAFVDGVETSDHYSRIVNRGSLEQTGSLAQATSLVRHKSPYYHSMATRLYHYHGSAVEPRPVVLSWQGAEQRYSGGTFTFAPSQQNTDDPLVRVFDSMEQAEQYVAESPETRQIGGIGANPTERIPALEHYRLVDLGNRSAMRGGFGVVRQRDARGTNLPGTLGFGDNRSGELRAINWMLRTTPAWVKTFERVPGATIEGTGPSNATVTASIRLDPADGSPFVYRQLAETNDAGEFEMTVPYASTGHDEWGVADGYANTSVKPANATAGYSLGTEATRQDDELVRHVGSVHVTEGQVLGENESVSTVTLERRASELITINGSEDQTIDVTTNSSTGSSGSGASGNEAGTGDDAGASDGTGTNDDTAGSLDPVLPPAAEPISPAAKP